MRVNILCATKTELVLSIPLKAELVLMYVIKLSLFLLGTKNELKEVQKPNWFYVCYKNWASFCKAKNWVDFCKLAPKMVF